MKRILAYFVAGIIVFGAKSQTEFDGIKLVNNDINGTARYVSMAGAFGALGGDPSAIKDNPAGLGVYRKGDLSLTINSQYKTSNANWNGTTTKEKSSDLDLSQLSIVFANPTNNAKSGNITGLLMSNWAFGFNRLKDFTGAKAIDGGPVSSSMTDYMAAVTRNIPNSDLTYTDTYEPFNNEYVPWMSVLSSFAGLISENVDGQQNTLNWNSILGTNEKVTPSYYLRENGYLDEYSATWSGNYSNRLFLGASLNYLSYDMTSESYYSESFENGGNFELVNNIHTYGKGLGFKFGAIVVPVDFMRVGISLKTPVNFDLTDKNTGELTYNVFDKGNIKSPTGTNYYQFRTPAQLSASTAFIVGDYGLIGLEYEYADINNSLFMDLNGNTVDYRKENNGFTSKFNNTGTLKIGGEYKLYENLALRAGYATTSASTKSTAVKVPIDNTVRTDPEFFIQNGTNYLTLGAGYKENNWHLDFGYMYRTDKEDYMPYNSSILSSNLAVTPAHLTRNNHNLVFTFGFRF